jgi:predicted ester cyclase
MQMNRREALTLTALTSFSVVVRAEPLVQAEMDVFEHTDLAAKNAATIRRHHDVLNSGDIPAAFQFFAENTRNHGVPVGRQGVLRVLTDIHTTFPDWHMEIETLAAIGDDVILRMIVTGTHKGVGRIPVNDGLLVGVSPSEILSKSSTSIGTR